MPLFNYGRVPGYAPGGRGINPETARIGGLPGGMDFLAGFGPAPAGVTDWTDPAIIHNKRLGSPLGLDRSGTWNFAQALRSGQIGPESSIYASFNPAQQALANSFRASAFPQYYGPNSRMDMSAEKLNSLGQSAVNAAPTTAAPVPVQLASGRTATMPGVAPTVTPTNTLSNNKLAAAIGSAAGTQWNDQNDPGGFIRKALGGSGIASWGNPGQIYGIGG